MEAAEKTTMQAREEGNAWPYASGIVVKLETVQYSLVSSGQVFCYVLFFLLRSIFEAIKRKEEPWQRRIAAQEVDGTCWVRVGFGPVVDLMSREVFGRNGVSVRDRSLR